MSDFGMFESDEATQAEPRLAAKTAARKLEAAIDGVRSQFGQFLVGATGIDEFEDRWHLSKHDIRASVESLVFPNTGTMRRIKNAMKADWKLAHPYKLALSHDEAGFGSMPEGDGHRNQHLEQTYHPSSGNLEPKPRWEEYKNEVDQGGPEKVEANDFTPGGDSGSDRHARRVHARDPKHYDMVGHEYDNINYPEGSPEIMEDEGDHQGVHDYYRNLMEEPPAGYPRRDRSFFEDQKSVVRPSPEEMFGNYNAPDSLGSFVEDSDPAARYLGSRRIAGDADNYQGRTWAQDQEASEWHDQEAKREEAEKKSDKKEAAMLVADIYTDFAQANGLRVASLDTLDHYASTGIAEADYRLLQSMIVRAAEQSEESEEEPDEDDEDDHEEPDADNAGGPSDGDEDNESDEDDDESDNVDEDYDFGGGDDDQGGESGGGQQYTVPEQAPDLDPQMLNEIPHDDTDGTAPVPPNVIDSLLGLPEGTIEQLLLQEVEQGQGGAPEQGGAPDFGGDQGAPEAGGDDFLGQGGDDAEQEPPRVARRRHTAATCQHCDADLKKDDGDWVDKHTGDEYCEQMSGDGPTDRRHTPSEDGRQSRRRQARQFWAAPDEAEGDLRSRQHQQYQDSLNSRFGPGPEADRPSPESSIRELYTRAQNGDREAYGHLQNLYKARGWTAARRFWAADDDQEPQEDPSGGGQPPQGDPSQGGGMDPSMMGGGMMPPPGSQSVAPPQPPAPLENQPAEDALLDTANQAIMQMIDRETQEYQQIIGPLSQALQAVQFAQQVEQSEHPMDVTPPQGSVNVDPSQAPGGAGNPQQQLARLVRRAKKDITLRNAAHLIANTYRVSERMLVEAMGRRHYEHVAEAFNILPPEARQTPEVRAAALHIAKMFAAENSMFNEQAFMDATVGQRAASGSRLPFDRPRLAGETLKNTPTMDRFEFANEQPEITDNMTINDLPKHTFKGLPKMKANQERLGWGTKGVAPKMPKMPSEKRGDDVMNKYQRYTDQRAQKGLNFGDNDVTVEDFLSEKHVGTEAAGKLHESLGISHPPTPKATMPKSPVPKAKNPALKKGTWGEWEPPKTASFFTRRVAGWKWDDYLNGYIAKEARTFTCACGEPVATPSYKTCKCGKIWNVYAIGDTHHLASDTADMFIAREIPVRDNVIMANKKLAKGDCECWDGYERVPGTKPCADGSCRKCDSHKKESRTRSHAELVAMIDKLADWTKYDGPDPARAFGKDKPADPKVAPPPSDWATRLPKGDPSKKGGTWTPPTIPRKKK